MGVELSGSTRFFASCFFRVSCFVMFRAVGVRVKVVVPFLSFVRNEWD